MSDASPTGGRTSALKAAGCGAAVAIGAVPPAAALVAVLYRFPVPMSGYASGFSGAGTAALGSVFYLVLGGVVVVATLGAAGGFLAARYAAGSRHVLRITVGSALIIACLAATFLSVLEFLIGPW